MPDPTCAAAHHDSTHGVVANSSYIDRLMRRRSFEALWPLFALADRPAKELTESYSALVHLRPLFAEGERVRVIHVGDGAHARTGALFALKTRAENLSVDPVLNVPLVEGWRDRFGIRRFEFWKARIADVSEALAALPPMRTLVTFVHAHVGVDAVLSGMRWDAAFTLACCVPGKQLSKGIHVTETGEDDCVLASGRTYQVLVNRAG